MVIPIQHRQKHGEGCDSRRKQEKSRRAISQQAEKARSLLFQFSCQKLDAGLQKLQTMNQQTPQGAQQPAMGLGFHQEINGGRSRGR